MPTRNNKFFFVIWMKLFELNVLQCQTSCCFNLTMRHWFMHFVLHWLLPEAWESDKKIALHWISEIDLNKYWYVRNLLFCYRCNSISLFVCGNELEYEIISTRNCIWFSKFALEKVYLRFLFGNSGLWHLKPSYLEQFRGWSSNSLKMVTRISQFGPTFQEFMQLQPELRSFLTENYIMFCISHYTSFKTRKYSK